jgi:hypothetical protein
MPLPKEIKISAEQLVSHYCEGRIPDEYLDRIRVGYKFRGRSITLYTERPSHKDPSQWVRVVVAQIRFDEGNSEWELYWADRNSRWHVYDLVEPSENLADLLDEVERDPTGIFWG